MKQLQDQSEASVSYREQLVKQFLLDNPQVQSIDLILHDLNGAVRGKRVEVNQLMKVAKDGICLPASVFALDICGETVEETGLGFSQGDGDRICQILPSSLCLVPWQGCHCAQGLLTMVEKDGVTPFFADPRQVLFRVLGQLSDQPFHYCVALELEFYLVDIEADETGHPRPPIAPFSQKRMTQTQVYSLDELDEYRPFLDDVLQACREQQIPAENMIAEYAPGQFEVNLHYQHDVLLACDQALLLKRVIKSVARKHGYGATFMAKPYSEYAGSGCHVHVSLLDDNGQNVFVNEPARLQHALAGLLKCMPEMMAIIAPNANSYRRFRPDMFVPLRACWGWDNRTVALRIPASNKANTRIEHRVGGADVNPYLICAAILASMSEGLTQKWLPAEPVSGDASLCQDELLPLNWRDALMSFSQSQISRKYFGSSFCQVYQSVKQSEMQRFESHVSPLEFQWYQQIV
ncbi:MAG: Gamma-glutamylputrescine synthetase PuuA [Candidatus Celerinatantimonas neptuna]|nr:MAG: Gamma-glutamylputrescine synthetase PuuA [Candidatus Celerinatantimonas neptuna]